MRVHLQGGAVARNVFWQVAGVVAIGTTAPASPAGSPASVAPDPRVLGSNPSWVISFSRSEPGLWGPILVNALAGRFVILSKSGITNVPTSAITGDVGTSPISGAAITGLGCGEVTGTIYTVDAAGPPCRVIRPARLTTAVHDMVAAYKDAAGRLHPRATELGAGQIGGLGLQGVLQTRPERGGRGRK